RTPVRVETPTRPLRHRARHHRPRPPTLSTSWTYCRRTIFGRKPHRDTSGTFVSQGKWPSPGNPSGPGTPVRATIRVDALVAVTRTPTRCAHLVLPAPGEHRRSRTDLARLQQVTQRLRGRVERDDRHDRRVPRRGDVVRVPVDHRLPRPHRVTLGNVHGEPRTVLFDRVDPQVHQYRATVLSCDDERVGMQCGHRAGDGSHRVTMTTLRSHGDAGTNHRIGEDRVLHLGDRYGRACDRAADRHPRRAHRRSSMSLAMLSASVPMITCATAPERMTPCAPACFN